MRWVIFSSTTSGVDDSIHNVLFLSEVEPPSVTGVTAITQSTKKIRTVFMGSDITSCTFLTALVHAPDFEVVAVVTKPDRKRGRKMHIVPGVVKELALIHCKPVLSPEKINSPESLQMLNELNPDVIVVMAYGQFLGKTLLELPRLGCVNVHVSLLPKYRGAAPVQYAILNGETETGVTAMMMDIGMDTGDILGAVRCAIDPEDTTKSLSLKLCTIGSDLMLDVLRQLDAGTATRVPQDHKAATFTHLIEKEHALMEWSESAIGLERKIRAFNPKPGCCTFLPSVQADENNPLSPGQLVKVHKAEVVLPPPRPPDAPSPAPGTILAMKGGLVVATGDGMALRLLEVLPEGKPRSLSGAEFANGCVNRLAVGDRLFPGLETVAAMTAEVGETASTQ